MTAGGGDQQQGEGQGRQVQRIDTRQAMIDELAEAEPARAETVEIDVRQDEARQDEEQVDAEIALVDQGRRRRMRSVRGSRCTE
ncbi:MAG: hypothetical protein WDN06_15010 [Asticcacaulis sp.]